jgi:hypothetical protein
VLPYAALNRPAYAGLRRGDFRTVAVRIVEAWSFDETVQPLFPVPASVMIGQRQAADVLPASVVRYTGILTRRDASEVEADRTLRRSEATWPPIPTLEGASPYRARFQDGATIYPRRFFFVERDAETRLGGNPNAPLLRGKAGKLDKAPWNKVEPPHGPVEIEFVRTVLLGESIAPFRMLATPSCVLPIHNREIMSSGEANNSGFRRLAAWMRDIETKWADHSAKTARGAPRMTIIQQIDYMRKLSAQLPVSPTRVVHATAGTLLAACIVTDASILVDHMPYWASARSMGEARYLIAVLNSETVRLRIEPMQAKGQGGARHFDNLVWELRIPEYERGNALHRELEAAAKAAEAVASTVQLSETAHFTRQRRAIRDALIGDGIAGKMDAMVARLLDKG